MKRALLSSLCLAAAACGGGEFAGDDDPPSGFADAGLLPPDADLSAEPTRYRPDRSQSPITPAVAATLRSIAQSDSGRSDVFMKVGDSITVSTGFMHCFASATDSLGADIDETVAAIGATSIDGTTPFDRESLAAGVGWSAGMPLQGSPSPLERELAAATPSMAVVMYGSNDAELGNLDRYGDQLLTIVDQLIDAGVVPILSTVPPRNYNQNDGRIPAYGAMARAVAESRQIPLVDLHKELLELPDFGLSGDGLHPRAVNGGCDFGESGLEGGYNRRNRITIDALDRVRRILNGSRDSYDEHDLAWGWQGQGTRSDPIRVAVNPGGMDLPFTHRGNTSESQERHIDSYGCAPNTDESGAEVWYELATEEAMRIQINLADQGEVDVDLHLLIDSKEADACQSRGHLSIDAELPTGTHYLVVDTFADEAPGEYLLTILRAP